MDAELQQSLESCVQAVKDASDGLPAPSQGGATVDQDVMLRLQWVERQLANIAGKLEALMADIEVGLSLHELGFSDPQEMQDLLDDMNAQIAQLRSMGMALSRSLERSL